MELLDVILESRARSVYVLGAARGTGKSTTLDQILTRAAARGIPAGVVSAMSPELGGWPWRGRAPDPAAAGQTTVRVPAGTMVATVRGMLDQGDAVLVPTGSTGVVVPRGEIVVARAEREGCVVLPGVGPSHLLRRVVQGLVSAGTALVALDGSLNPMQAASPAAADGVILATGASASPLHSRSVDQSASIIGRLRLPSLPASPLREAAEKAAAWRKMALIDENCEPSSLRVRYPHQPREFVREILEEMTQEPEAPQRTRAIVFGAVMPRSVLEEMLDRPEAIPLIDLIAVDGTRIQTLPRAWRTYCSLGGRLWVLERINLLAVTVNPVPRRGTPLPAREFLEQIAGVAVPLPVFDLVRRVGLKSTPILGSEFSGPREEKLAR